MELMLLFLLVGVVAFSVLAVLARDLLKAAIALAVASIFLALVFFRLGGYYVGVFELSIVAGLITVLFITTINLTRHQEKDAVESKWPRLIFPLFFIAMLALDYLLLKKLQKSPGALSLTPSGAEAGKKFGDVLWGERTFDLIGQIGAIFAGVFAVLALFRKRGKHE